MKKICLIILILLFIVCIGGCEETEDAIFSPRYTTSSDGIYYIHVYETGKCYKIKGFVSSYRDTYTIVLDDGENTKLMMYSSNFAFVSGGKCPFCED